MVKLNSKPSTILYPLDMLRAALLEKAGIPRHLAGSYCEQCGYQGLLRLWRLNVDRVPKNLTIQSALFALLRDLSCELNCETSLRGYRLYYLNVEPADYMAVFEQLNYWVATTDADKKRVIDDGIADERSRPFAKRPCARAIRRSPRLVDIPRLKYN